MSQKEVLDPKDPANTVANPDVITKYKTSADIVTKALKVVISKCVAGASIMELCILGDQSMEEGLKTVYVKSKVTKGIAFPTAISVNNCIRNFSPIPSEKEASHVLKNGDVVKIEMAAHIDGFPAIVGHTHVIGADKSNPVTGKSADALMAAHLSAEASLRLFSEGNKTNDISKVVSKIAESFDCKPVESTTSYQILKDNANSEKTVIINPSEEQKKSVTSDEFQEGEVYAVCILISTGEGKAKAGDATTTIYRKTNTTYQLKLKASRVLLNDVKDRFGCYGFNLRSFEDLRKARMGLHECLSHQVIQPFDVSYEKEGEIVASFVFTTLILKNGPMKITGLDWDADIVKTEKEITDEELKNLLNEQVRKKKNKKKN